VTINVLHACARDIQSRVRGRIVRATRQRECGAAARIQAWYHGWRVRARYSAVLQKMRTHRIERQKRMQVRPDHTRPHQTTPDTPVRRLTTLTQLLCLALLYTRRSMFAHCDGCGCGCGLCCAVLLQNFVYQISTLKPSAKKLVAKMRDRKRALHAELRRYVSLRKFRRYAARALDQSREEVVEAKRAAKRAEWDDLNDHEQINQLLRDDSDGVVSLKERPNDEGWTLTW
jgi:hypothetical protein